MQNIVKWALAEWRKKNGYHDVSLGSTTPYGAPVIKWRPGRGASQLCQAAVDGYLAGGHETAV